MKYRAVAVGLTEDGRAVQTFSAHEYNVNEWALKIAESKNVPVEVYVYEERLLRVVHPDSDAKLDKSLPKLSA